MVWSYHSVKELRQDYKQGKDVSIQQQRKLEKYIKRKKKTPNHKEWKKTQLLKAERLLHQIKQDREDRETVEVTA